MTDCNSTDPRSAIRWVRLRIATGASGGQFPFPADEGQKAIADPIPDGEDGRDGLAGMSVDGLQQFRHFRQSLGVAHGGARAEDLTMAAVVVPPEGDPIPRAAGLAFLQAAALKTAAAHEDALRDNPCVVHRSGP